MPNSTSLNRGMSQPESRYLAAFNERLRLYKQEKYFVSMDEIAPIAKLKASKDGCPGAKMSKNPRPC